MNGGRVMSKIISKEINCLRKEVNLFDEDQGLNLKKLDNIKMKKLYKRRLIIIYKLIALYTIFVAKIPNSKVFKNGKKYDLKRKVTEGYLKNHSPLFEAKANSIKDSLFQKQFFCLLMSYVMEELDSIIRGQLITHSDKISINENKIVYLMELYNDSMDYLIGTVTFRGDYQTPLLNLYEKLTLREVKNRYQSNPKWIHYIRMNMESTIGYHDDLDIAMNEIIRLAYSVSTNKIKYPKDFLLPFNERVSSETLKRVLRRLGKEMIRDWDKNGRPLFVHIFFKCAPLAYTKFSDINEDLYLNYGVKMIQLIDYMLDDRKIHRIITDMIL